MMVVAGPAGMGLKPFLNLAWQIFVDKLVANADEFCTEEVTVQMDCGSVPQYGGNLQNAIRSKNPGMNDVEIAAEEVVDTVMVAAVANGLPTDVFSPVATPAWNTHSQEH